MKKNGKYCHINCKKANFRSTSGPTDVSTDSNLSESMLDINSTGVEETTEVVNSPSTDNLSIADDEDLQTVLLTGRNFDSENILEPFVNELS